MNASGTTPLANLRTSAGIPTRDGGRLTGLLVRSCDPRHASVDQVAHIRNDLAVTAVIDLRSAHEVADLGPSLADLPHVYADLTLPRHDSGLTGHLDPERLARWLPAAVETIATTDGATLVHCQAGWDRTGIVSCLLQTLAGATADAAAADWAATVDNLPTLRVLLGADPYIRTNLPQGLRRLDEASAAPEHYRAQLRDTAHDVIAHIGGPDGARDLALRSGVDPRHLDTAVARLQQTAA